MISSILYCMLFVGFVSFPVKATLKRSDDFNLQALQNIIQQQSVVIQTLQAKQTTMENTLISMGNTIKQQSAVMQTMQTNITAVDSKLMKHVSFSADFRLNEYAQGKVNIGKGGVVKFSNILSNSGDGYNATTGVFTAPVAGNYGFYLSIRSDAAPDYVVVALAKNSVEICDAVVQGAKEVLNDKGACFAISHLNVGDKVLARQQDGATYLEEWLYTTFSGFLLFAD